MPLPLIYWLALVCFKLDMPLNGERTPSKRRVSFEEMCKKRKESCNLLFPTLALSRSGKEGLISAAKGTPRITSILYIPKKNLIKINPFVKSY